MSALLTLPQLLRDEEYAEYFKRNTRTFKSACEQPWQIVALRNDGKWANGFRPDFLTAFKAIKKLHRSGEYKDFSIVSRNRIFSTPKVLSERLCDATAGHEWCGRCRRPTIFQSYGVRHHALRHAPVIVAYQCRCYYCGISYDFHQGIYGKAG